MELAGRKTPARHEPSAEPPLPRSSAIAAKSLPEPRPNAGGR
jgi:hypothetical protein